MAKNNMKVIIFLIVGVLLFTQFQKEAVIPDYVNPGSSVSVMGELQVKPTATAWVPGPATQVHWMICSDSDCLNVVDEGYEQLTGDERADLEARLVDPLSKTTIYYMDFTAPMSEGYYYYEAQAETSSMLDVVSIEVDGFVMFGNSNRFYVQGGVPCADYTDEEIVSISHGTIRVTVYHTMVGDYPDCTETSREDIGFVVICDNGYDAIQNGRQSTCSQRQCGEGQITQWCYCENQLSNTGYCCNNVYSSTPCCTPNCACEGNTCIGQTCDDGCGGTCPGTKDCSECTPDCSCATNTCVGSTCTDPTCNTQCVGTKDCGDEPTTCSLDSECNSNLCQECSKGNCVDKCIAPFTECESGECKVGMIVWIIGGVLLLLVVLSTLGGKKK